MTFDVRFCCGSRGMITLPLMFETQTNSKAGLYKEYLNNCIYKF